MTKIKKVVFLDTNILLHYTFFTDIDWPLVVDASEVKLVIAPIVMREIEKRKYAEKEQFLRERAQKISTRLAKLFLSGEEVRPHTKILFEAREPDEEFASLQLSRETQDDHLLASVRLYMREHPEDTVLVVSNDFPLQVKAAPLSIEIQRLPEEFQIPAMIDPNVKRIRDLERQLRDATNRLPQPELLFDNGLSRFTFNVPAKTIPTEGFLDRMQEIRMEYPKIQEPPASPKQSLPARTDPNTVFIPASNYPANMPSRSDIQKYNQSLEAFYKEYEEYLGKMDKAEELNRRKIELKIRLENPGTAPLESAVVFMTIPHVVRLTRHDSEFKYPKEPSPPPRPKPPRTAYEVLSGFRESPGSSFYLPRITRFDRSDRYVEPPNIETNAFESDDDEYRVSFRVRRATHYLIYDCPYDLYAVFESLESARSFKIEWRIVAANLPKPVDGLLHVIVQRGSDVDEIQI